MYAPKQFREERRDVLVEAVRALQFAAIVIRENGRFSAAHAPILIRDEADGLVVELHLSRGNPLWREVGAGCPALAIVQGPQAYIHPGWYETKKQTGKAVPTWNYVSIHIEGRLTLMEDRGWLVRHLEDLTQANEAGRADPWTLDDAPPEYIDAQVRGIVGLELRVERLQGVWKMIQHHPEANKLGVIEGLSASAKPGDRIVAGVMQDMQNS